MFTKYKICVISYKYEIWPDSDAKRFQNRPILLYSIIQIMRFSAIANFTEGRGGGGLVIVDLHKISALFK